MADTMGSFEDAYSHGRLHKTIAFPDEEVYATAAGNVAVAAEIMPIIVAQLQDTPKEKRTHGDILRAIATASFNYRRDRFNLEVLPRFFVPPYSPNAHLQVPLEERPEMVRQFNELDTGADMILATFDWQGQALLYLLNSQGETHTMSFPGFAAIGSGAENAMFWLSYRQHVLGMSPSRAAYHAYEAKLMAEKSAHVNEHLDIIFAQPGRYEGISSHKPNSSTSVAPFTAEMLKVWQEQYRPRDTADLDRASMRSTSHSSKDSP